MRISTSTIVMAALVCIPFGLAIRDTIHAPAVPGIDRAEDDGDGEDEDASDDQARYEAEEAEREAQEVRDQDARKASMSELLGAEPASLGGKFGAVHLGERDELVLSQAMQRFERDEQTTGFTIELVGAHGLSSITITPDGGEDSDGCRDLAARLTEVWGVYESDERGEVRIWLNAATGQRAVFEPGGTCTVTIERFVTPDQFVGTAATAIIPVTAIGRPVKELQATHPEAVLDDYALTWEAPGVGAGVGGAQLRAVLVGGKVGAIVAYANMAPATQDAVTEHLSSLFGAPAENGTMLVWKRAPNVTLDTGNPSSTAIVVGRLAK